MAIILAGALLGAGCSGANQIQPFEEAGSGGEGEIALGPTVATSDERLDPEPTPTTPTTLRSSTTAPALPTLPPTTLPPEPVTVLAAGNLGGCDSHSAAVLAAIAERTEPVVAAGDLSADGTEASLQDCFAGPFGDLDRLIAVPGDRDLAADEGAAFYELIDQTSVETTAGEGWFVATIGDWQLIGLNSRCDDVGGCDPESPQFQWLDETLLEQPAECRIAVFHDARFTSTLDEDDTGALGALIGRLDGAGTDVILTGSVGNYERLGPIRPNGRPPGDERPGIMHFNVGSIAGAGFEEVRQPGSAHREGDVAGFLSLELASDGYTWEFVGVSNEEPLVFDSGSGRC